MCLFYSDTMGAIVHTLKLLIDYTVFNVWLVAIVALVFAIKIYQQLTGRQWMNVTQMDGRTVVVTGANSGEQCALLSVSYTHLDVYKRQA